MKMWCSNSDCQLDIPSARWNLGYRLCIECAEKVPPRTYNVLPAYNKGPAMLVTDECLIYVGKK